VDLGQTLLGAYAALAEIGAGLDQVRPDAPVLFVHGESDQVVPVEVARRSAAQLPRAQIRTFPGACTTC
jgi:pimeloyl-ACP methyl ester carboxylesterase